MNAILSCKYNTRRILVQGDLNWIQHWVSRLGLLSRHQRAMKITRVATLVQVMRQLKKSQKTARIWMSWIFRGKVTNFVTRVAALQHCALHSWQFVTHPWGIEPIRCELRKISRQVFAKCSHHCSTIFKIARVAAALWIALLRFNIPVTANSWNSWLRARGPMLCFFGGQARQVTSYY